MKHFVSALIISVFILSYGMLQPVRIPLLHDAQALETIYVTADKKAGRYDGPIYVKITASNPDAKIWYTCKRNGTPSDLLKYEKPILLKKSCALIYFAYVDTQLESKIERTDYTILYSDDVKLETENQILSLRNTGTETVDVGNWEIIAGTGSITIQPGTTILPGEHYSIGKVDPASYELKSPEWYTKNQIAVAPLLKPQEKIQTTKPVAASPKTVDSPTKIADSLLKTVETLPQEETTESPTQVSIPTPTAPNSIPKDAPDGSPEDTPYTAPKDTPSANEDSKRVSEPLKASANEAESGSSTTPIALGILGLAGAAAIAKNRSWSGKAHQEK